MPSASDNGGIWGKGMQQGKLTENPLPVSKKGVDLCKRLRVGCLHGSIQGFKEMKKLFGIWYKSQDGKLTLCESDEKMSVYYDCAFSKESEAVAYAKKLTQDLEFPGFSGTYVALPLPEGCVAQWVD